MSAGALVLGLTNSSLVKTNGLDPVTKFAE